jgi:hypothetical protein
MEPDRGDEPILDPSFFEDRFLIQISRWDWNLHVGLSSEAVPAQYRFQGGLDCTRAFALDGEIIAPAAHRAKGIRISLSPFGPDMRFGSADMDEVGQLYFPRAEIGKSHFSTTLLIPEDAIAATAACLGSVWKYLHIWVFDRDTDRASVRAFSFSSRVHKNLDRWIAGG